MKKIFVLLVTLVFLVVGSNLNTVQNVIQKGDNSAVVVDIGTASQSFTSTGNITNTGQNCLPLMSNGTVNAQKETTNKDNFTSSGLAATSVNLNKAKTNSRTNLTGEENAILCNTTASWKNWTTTIVSDNITAQGNNVYFTLKNSTLAASATNFNNAYINWITATQSYLNPVWTTTTIAMTNYTTAQKSENVDVGYAVQKQLNHTYSFYV